MSGKWLAVSEKHLAESELEIAEGSGDIHVRGSGKKLIWSLNS